MKLFWQPLILGLSLICLLFGCAGAQRNSLDEGVVDLDPDERLVMYRGALRELSDHRYAKSAASDLARAQSWLDSLQNRNIDMDDDDERGLFELRLEAIEGELVKVRSFYRRKEAEAALERAREKAAGETETAERLRKVRRGRGRRR